MDTKIKRAIEDIQKDNLNFHYFIINLLRSKDENFIQTLLTAYLNKNSNDNKIYLNETEVNVFNTMFNSNLSKGNIDLIEVENGDIQSIVEIKIAYLKEFYKGNALRESVEKTTPSGIRRQNYGILTDIEKRGNSAVKTMGLYILKDVTKLNKNISTNLKVAYPNEIQEQPGESKDVDKIVGLLDDAIKAETPTLTQLRGYKASKLGEIDFGEYGGYALKLHFFAISK